VDDHRDREQRLQPLPKQTRAVELHWQYRYWQKHRRGADKDLDSHGAANLFGSPQGVELPEVGWQGERKLG